MAFDFSGLLNNVKKKITPFVSGIADDPGRFWIGRGVRDIAPMTSDVLSPVVGRQTAEDIGYGLQGAGRLTPFSIGQQYPQNTPRQQMAEDVGRFAYGAAATAPLTGGSTISRLLGIGKNAIIGGAFGAGSTTVSTAWNEQRLPTSQELLAGAGEGAKNSWIYPLTNKATDMAIRNISKALPAVAPKLMPYTDEALSASGQATKALAPQGLSTFLPRSINQVTKTALREGMESPLETAYFAAADQTGGDNYLERYKNRFLPDLASNLVVGAGRGSLSMTPATIRAGKADIDATVNDPNFNPKSGYWNIGQIQDQLKTMATKAPEVVPEPPKPEPDKVRYVQSVENAKKSGYKPDTIQRLVNEGYEPSTITNIFKMAKDQEKIKTNGVFAYNYFKKAATDQGIKPTKPGAIITQKGVETQSKFPQDDQSYLDSLVASEGDFGKPTKPLQEILSSTKPEVTQQTQVSDYKTRVQTVQSKEDVSAVIQEGSQQLNDLELNLKQQGSSIEKAVDDLENGVDNQATNTIKEWFDTFKARAEADGVKIDSRKNYFTHITDEKADEIIKNGVKPSTFGSILQDVYFGKERTGKLTDYSKSTKAMLAYAIEAMKNAHLSPEEKADIKLASDIKEEVTKTIDTKTGEIKQQKASIWRGIPLKSIPDYVGKIQDATKSFREKGDTKKVVYDGKDKASLTAGISQTFRSNAQRAEQAGKQFYDAFFVPFREAEINVNKYIDDLFSMDEAQLKSLYESETGRSPVDKDRTEMISQLSSRYYGRIFSEATNVFNKNAKVADFKKHWMKELANSIFDEYVGDGIRQKGLAEKIMTGIRINTGRATLGLNVASAVNNIFEIKRIASAVSTKSFYKGIANVIAGKDYTKEFGIDSKSSTALERNIYLKQLEKFDKALFYMFDKSERLKDNILLAALKEQALEKGLSGKELNDFVIKKFDNYAVKYGRGQDIGLFRSPVARTLFQFAQYPIKDAVILADKFGGAIKKDKGDLAYLVKYASYSALQMMLMKAVIGQIGFGGQTNTPIDTLASLSKGEVPVSPVVQSILLAGGMLTDEVRGIEPDDYEKDQRNKKMQRSLSAVAIPASNQLWFKTGKAIQAQQQGYQEKFGGNVANPVSTDPFSVGKTLLFGQSYDPKRQQYIKDYKEADKNDNGFAGLDKNQSAVFRNTPREKQQQVYDEFIAVNKQRSANKDYLASLTEEKEPGFLDGILGRKTGGEYAQKEEKKGLLKNWFGGSDQTPTTTIPPEDAPPAIHSQYKGLLSEKIGLGETLTPEEATYYYLDNKTIGDQKTSGEIDDYYTKVLGKFTDPDIPDSTKLDIMEKSGIEPQDFDYYMRARGTDDEKLQDSLSVYAKALGDKDPSKLTDAEREDIFAALIANKRTIGNKAIFNSKHSDYLYDRGIITKDEKKFIDAFKYDELTESFYTDRDYEFDGWNTSGDGNGLTLKEALSLMNKVYSNFPGNTETKTPKTPSVGRVSRTTQDKPISQVLKIRTRKSGGKTWFKPY